MRPPRRHLFGTPPVADMQVDVCRFLADPAAPLDRGTLDLDGRDLVVQQVVCATPGAIPASVGWAGSIAVWPFPFSRRRF